MLRGGLAGREQLLHERDMLGLLPILVLRQEVLLRRLLLLLWSERLQVHVRGLLTRGGFWAGFGFGVLAAFISGLLLAVSWILWAKAQVEQNLDVELHQQELKTRPLLKPPRLAEVSDVEPEGGAHSLQADLGSWRLETLTGQQVRGAELEGRPLFINFWATWCAPCVAELPSIQALIARMRESDDRFRFLLVTDEEAPLVDAFLRRREDLGDLPVYLAHEGVPAELWFVVRPTTFIVDCEGKIVLRHTGPADWSAPSVRSFLDSILDPACES